MCGHHNKHMETIGRCPTFCMVLIVHIEHTHLVSKVTDVNEHERVSKITLTTSGAALLNPTTKRAYSS